MKKGNGKKKVPKQTLPTGWYLMIRKESGVMDLKDAVLSDAESDEKYDVEVWQDAGVLEIGYKVPGEAKTSGSLDIEVCDLDMGDEYSNAYLAEHGVKSLYYLSFRADDTDKSVELMKLLGKKLDGFCAADTDDFMPVI